MKKPDTAKSRRWSKWPKATLEAEVKALREEISSLQGRVSELEAASHAISGAVFRWRTRDMRRLFVS